MKLSDVSSDNKIKLLLYGDSGTGKTCFAAGFPTPILYLDFDGKVNSAARFHSADVARLNDIDVRILTPSLVEDPVVELQKIIEEIRQHLKTGDLKYKTIVIDSLTTFSTACLRHVVKVNPGILRGPKDATQASRAPDLKDTPSLQDYGILKRQFLTLIPGLLSLPLNVVMLGHIKIEKDEDTGAIVRSCMMDGSFGHELNIYFEEVYHSYVKDGRYMAQTKADSKLACRSQIPGLAANIELKYENLIGGLQHGKTT